MEEFEETPVSKGEDRGAQEQSNELKEGTKEAIKNQKIKDRGAHEQMQPQNSLSLRKIATTAYIHSFPHQQQPSFIINIDESSFFYHLLTIYKVNQAMDKIYERIGNFYININQQQGSLTSSQQYEMIGKGNFGAVYLGKFHVGAQTIQTAVKIVPGDLDVDHRRREIFEREADLLMALKNLPAFEDSHIVQLYGYKMSNGKGYLFEQLCQGNLRDVMEDKAQPDAVVAKYFKQILVGLDFMHSNGVIHRDLKPDNILIDKQGSIKIADFGLSRIFETGNELQMTSGVGTFIYQAPEVVNHEYDQRCDVWSAGLILYQFLTGISWENVTEDQIYNRNIAIREGNFKLSFPGRDPIWERLLKKMLAYYYKERGSSKEILAEYLAWYNKAEGKLMEKEVQMPAASSLFKTYTQYEKGKKQQGQEQLQEQSPAQVSLEDVEYKQAETRLIQSLGIQNYFPSVINYIEYLDYYHHFKNLMNITNNKILNTMCKNQTLKTKFNSFFIRTNKFFAESIVYLRYKELLQQMEKLKAGSTIERNLDENQKKAYLEAITIKQLKFKAYVDDYAKNYKANIQAYLQYQKSLPELPHYQKVFEYLKTIKNDEKQVAFQGIAKHQVLLLQDIDILLLKEDIHKMTEDEVTIVFLCKRLREITKEMREGFLMMSSLERKSIREREKKGVSLGEMLIYLKSK